MPQVKTNQHAKWLTISFLVLSVVLVVALLLVVLSLYLWMGGGTEEPASQVEPFVLPLVMSNSNFAGFVKLNMPFGATYEHPQLTDEKAWNVAAFVNSQPCPTKDFSQDWPNLASKPYDHPFGPYEDPFTEEQHKYGPYGPIKQWIKQHKATKP